MGEWRPEWFNSISTPYSIAIALYNPETHNFWMIMITGYTLCVRAQKHNKVDEEAQSWKFQRASRAGSTRVVRTSVSDERVWRASSSKANWQMQISQEFWETYAWRSEQNEWPCRPWQDSQPLASTTSSSSRLVEYLSVVSMSNHAHCPDVVLRLNRVILPATQQINRREIEGNWREVNHTWHAACRGFTYQQDLP